MTLENSNVIFRETQNGPWKGSASILDKFNTIFTENAKCRLKFQPLIRLTKGKMNSHMFLF